MSENQPSHDVLHRLVHAAMLAPTAENCQPFSFVWNGKSLDVHHNVERAAHPLSCNFLTSQIALGCLMEAIALQSSVESWSPHFSLHLPDQLIDSLEGNPWLSVRFEPSTSHEADPLLEGLPFRCTDRRVYQGGDPADPLLASLEADSSDCDSTALRFLSTAPPKELVKHIVACDELFWHKPEGALSALKWIRFDDEQVSSTQDGVSGGNLAFSRLETEVLRWMPRSASLFRTMGTFGGKVVYGYRVTQQLRSACTLGCFATSDLSPQGIVQAGRRILRAWIRLNMAGYGFHPYSMVSMVALGAQHQLTGPLPVNFQRLFREGQTLLRRHFGLGPSQSPIWLFRAGKVDPLPKKHRTLRRPVQEVFSYEPA
ncbi:MAG: hypothetical protein EP343_27435 [Deltaproteobacteria bacterium]|nr:MAG: hypothetical protein EP343_27435 [Deltaproteobacteria bacterium]